VTAKKRVVFRGVLPEPTPVQAKAQLLLPAFKMAALRPDLFAEVFGEQGAAFVEQVHALAVHGVLLNVAQARRARVTRLRLVSRWRERFSDDDDVARGQIARLAAGNWKDARGRAVKLPADERASAFTTIAPADFTPDKLALFRTFDPAGKGGRGRRGHAFLAALLSVLSAAPYVKCRDGEPLARTVDREAQRIEDAERDWAENDPA
jgi:hypothetical protein